VALLSAGFFLGLVDAAYAADPIYIACAASHNPQRGTLAIRTACELGEPRAPVRRVHAQLAARMPGIFAFCLGLLERTDAEHDNYKGLVGFLTDLAIYVADQIWEETFRGFIEWLRSRAEASLRHVRERRIWDVLHAFCLHPLLSRERIEAAPAILEPWFADFRNEFFARPVPQFPSGLLAIIHQYCERWEGVSGGFIGLGFAEGILADALYSVDDEIVVNCLGVLVHWASPDQAGLTGLLFPTRLHFLMTKFTQDTPQHHMVQASALRLFMVEALTPQFNVGRFGNFLRACVTKLVDNHDPGEISPMLSCLAQFTQDYTDVTVVQRLLELGCEPLLREAPDLEDSWGAHLWATYDVIQQTDPIFSGTVGPFFAKFPDINLFNEDSE
jgi:hypothetical protein